MVIGSRGLILESIRLATQKLRRAHLHVLEIIHSRFHLDDLKTVGGVWDTTFHQHTNCLADRLPTPFFFFFSVRLLSADSSNFSSLPMISLVRAIMHGSDQLRHTEYCNCLPCILGALLSYEIMEEPSYCFSVRSTFCKKEGLMLKTMIIQEVFQTGYYKHV